MGQLAAILGGMEVEKREPNAAQRLLAIAFVVGAAILLPFLLILLDAVEGALFGTDYAYRFYVTLGIDEALVWLYIRCGF